MNKQEFIDKILEVGGGRAIDWESMPQWFRTGEWYYYGGCIAWAIKTQGHYSVYISYILDHNPPSNIDHIRFYYWGTQDCDEVPDNWAIARINELPFVGEEKTCTELGGTWCEEGQLCGGEDVTDQASDRGNHPNQICCIGNCYTLECEEGAHEVLEYCPDAITEKRWRDCISGAWVEDLQVCPGCPEGAHEVLEYCPDAITEKRWRDCISGAWVEDSQVCPDCYPEGATACGGPEGYDLYECINSKWVRTEHNSVECGYTPKPPFPCPIACVCIGTPLIDALGPIREFRDRYLKTNWSGRKFVSFYYGGLTSWLAPLLMRHNRLKQMGRVFIVYPLKKLCEWIARKR